MTVNDFVIHNEYGRGTIIAFVSETTAVVRFDNDLENAKIISVDSLKEIASVESQINANIDDTACTKAIAHIQASIIRYVNDTWGVFSRSAIELLPHQLWVCKQVLKQWPLGYVVADDVGLGKTIEAGLIISSLAASKRAKRILILTPPKLVKQWCDRLYSMFDLRFSTYMSGNETSNPHFWDSTDRVIASATTVQMDNNGRHDHIMKAAPWDLVIIDEAHHMNAEEKNKTLQFKFFEKLRDNGKVVSTILFTGTPHRGKNYGFWSLMSLVNPDVFGPDKDEESQYAALKDYFIRNNKQNVVNMEGEKLFTKMTQHPYEFKYSDAEEAFYNEMSEFISSGFMYARSLGSGGTAVGLLLTSLQKIASSSIAAISSALNNRKLAITNKRDMIKDLETAPDEETEEETRNQEAALKLVQDPLKLMENEIQRIDELLNLASLVKSETRITKIIDIIKKNYSDNQVLLFTEYKRTQALMMSELMKVWGDDCVTIINGDECLNDIKYPDGSFRNMAVSREQACKDFNEGKKKFLISTEAAGEGIDLQDNCHVLIHIDLPWNPMRLHQRVGRVHRLGQKKDVEVVSVRNSENIETRIWEYLETKIAQIQRMLSASMEDPDDMAQLVLGMPSENFYEEVFKNSSFEKAKSSVDSWFDSKSKTFGGDSAIETATKLGLNAAKFNLQGLANIPKLDLPNLPSFMKNVLKLKGKKRLMYDAETDTYSFVIPTEWNSYGNIGTKKGLIFRRQLKKDENNAMIVGVGSVNLNKAIEEALLYDCLVATIVGSQSYFLYSVVEENSSENGRSARKLFALEYDSKKNYVKNIQIDDFYLVSENIKVSIDDDRKHLQGIPFDVQNFANQHKETLGFEKPVMELVGVLCGEM